MDVADCTALDASDHRVLVAEHRDHEDVALRLALRQLADQREAVTVRQREVSEQNVGGVALEPGARRRERAERRSQSEARMRAHAALEKEPRVPVVLQQYDTPRRVCHGSPVSYLPV